MELLGGHEMSKRRTFSEVVGAFNERRMNEFCKKIALDYLSITNGHPRSYICDTYWISDSCYRACLRRAVVRGLVTQKQTDQMLALSISNQRLNCPETSGDNSRTNYDKWREERRQYLIHVLRRTRKGKKIQITKMYANDSTETIYTIGMKENLPYAAVSKIIEDTIVSNMVDDEIVRRIQNKMLATNDYEKVVKQFTRYKTLREKNRKN